MRLTLRTLLAYLDNTLDPQDVQALRDKLTESGFATQLVNRIRDTLASKSLAAPSPQAVGPVEEANVISEYLDSTLPSEQVAEIERACLESDPHLAEAAACHQILTMVLGESAEVSPELRQRIYELPDKNIEEIAASAGSFSSVLIPEQPELGSLQDAIPTSDVGRESALGGQPVTPVGIADSGVSDAPTRLRESEVALPDGTTNSGPAIAGSKPRSLEDSSAGYGRSIRTSRITPWLVSLALAGVLLFALAKIFLPLLTPDPIAFNQEDNVADLISGDPEELPSEVDVAAADSPPMVDVENPVVDVSPAEKVETLPPPNGVAEEVVGEDVSPKVAVDPEDMPLISVETPETSEVPSVAPDLVVTPDLIITADKVDPAPAKAIAAVDPADPAMPKTNVDAVPGVGVDPVAPPPPAAGDVDDPQIIELAKVTSDDALLLGMTGAQKWVRLKKDMPVGDGHNVICAPTFRGELTSVANVKVTLVGSTQVHWSGSDDSIRMHVDFGRVLISATEPDTSVDVTLGDLPLTIDLPEIDTIIAVSVEFSRAAGDDPLAADKHKRLAQVLSVQGNADLNSAGVTESLATGQQWIKSGDAAAKISPANAVPDWIDPPDPTEPSLESAAREGLLAILGDDQDLGLSLREATSFRRSEVGALAGRTLLVMGRADVYFGGDGILSEAKQRAYWPDHFQTLMETVDRSAEHAAEVRRSVEKMDSANARAIQRLMTGYSQRQLVEGGDEELVKLLDSPSMAVRVLALENLHKITGTTLYFRAEQDNAIRRAPGIKKWEVRQRKGDIQWQE